MSIDNDERDLRTIQAGVEEELYGTGPSTTAFILQEEGLLRKAKKESSAKSVQSKAQEVDLIYARFVEWAVNKFPQGQHQKIIQQLHEMMDGQECTDGQKVLYAMVRDLPFTLDGKTGFTLKDKGLTAEELGQQKRTSIGSKTTGLADRQEASGADSPGARPRL